MYKYFVMYQNKGKDGALYGGSMKSFDTANDAYNYLEECEANNKSSRTIYYVNRLKCK